MKKQAERKSVDKKDAIVSIRMEDRKMLDAVVMAERARTNYPLSIKMVMGRAIKEMHDKIEK